MKRLLLPALLCFLICFLIEPALSAGGDQTVLMQELARLNREYGGHLGVCAKNLNTGELVMLNAAERFPTASVIKLPVMATFFHLVDQKQVDPNTRVVLTGQDKKPGSGILQFLSDSTTMSLVDGVKLMIILSDNTATNLVLDRIAASHEVRMAVVNDFLAAKGLKNTRLLNRLYSLQTKKQTPEAIRYGIGVSTPEDMVTLLEGIYNKTMADSGSCAAMLDIMKQQQYNEMIPRLLPADECKFLDVAHKTGEINETKVDVGLILSDKVTMALAVFVDKHPDHREGLNNQAVILGAYAARAVWNHFAGDSGYGRHYVRTHDPDWNRFPGGSWLIYRSSAAPFPHKDRMNGFTSPGGVFYPYFPHYADSSVVVVVPDGFKETPEGTNVIVHFHGHMNDDLGTLETYQMPKALVEEKINALLVIPQGPYRARDSFGGRMEDEGGLKRLVDDVLVTMKGEDVVKTVKLNKVILSAHSGGYRPAAFCLDRGGLNDHITDVFLFDAFYGNLDMFRSWLNRYDGKLFAVYTEHLTTEHEHFKKETAGDQLSRISFTKTTVEHEQVVQAFLADWLSKLNRVFKMEQK